MAADKPRKADHPKADHPKAGKKAKHCARFPHCEHAARCKKDPERCRCPHNVVKP